MTHAPPLNAPPPWAPADVSVSVSCFAVGAWRLLLTAQCLAIVGIAVFFRGWQLGNIPGINGDEAWYGVQCEMLLHGEPFSGRTPTGNWLNPFFFAPLVALHALVGPSFELLRVTPLVSGLLALIVNFFLCCRAFDLRTATISTVALAVLPINIAYSRFAWDASQSLLFTLPVAYAPFIAAKDDSVRTRWSMIGAIAILAAYLVHPTNVFVAPWLVIGLAFAWSDRLKAVWTRYHGACVASGIACIVVGATAAARWWPHITGHVIATDNYPAFVNDLAGLFSGVTAYEYISGTLGPHARDATRAFTIEVVLTVVTAFIACLVVWAYYRRIRRGRSTLDLALAIAWISCVVAFFLVAGPEAIRPHFERYAICLIAPTIVLFARGLHWWMQPSTRFSFATAPLLIVLAWTSLFVFKRQYFDEFANHGGNSHRTFHTAATEPKQAALALILERSPTDVPVQISTSEWWLYWPLRYLAYAHDQIQVEQRDGEDSRSIEEQLSLDRDHWIVEFAEEEAGWRLKRLLDASKRGLAPSHDVPIQSNMPHGEVPVPFLNLPIDVERHTIYDPDQRPILLLFRLPAQHR